MNKTSLLSPALLMPLVWLVILFAVAVGPIDYFSQPSWPVLVIVGCGVGLFCAVCRAGTMIFDVWIARRTPLPLPSQTVLNRTVVIASLLGLAGIAMIALDRTVLSGVNNSGYAALLRCAPELVDYIEIKRTVFIYLGYVTFSFGFVSLALFLLRGEEIQGWPAALAQLSILSPVGYALLYSGRMPILLVIALIFSVGLVRLVQGRSFLPRGYRLAIKTVLFAALFMFYANAMWSVRQNFCSSMSGLVEELRLRVKEQASRAATQANERRVEILRQLGSPNLSQEERQHLQQQLNAIDGIIATAGKGGHQTSMGAENLSEMIEKRKGDATLPVELRGGRTDFALFAAVMRDAWHAQPRGYVLSAAESQLVPENSIRSILSNYFYLTHGVRTLDTVWQARENLTPVWGVYEVGILSPLLRVFFPDNQTLSSMSSQLRSAEIYGFFPSAWGAAYIDFGASGATIYIVLWGLVAGLSFRGSQVSKLTTPPLILTFIFSSIALSPLQGPLGIANSALVLVSMLIVGLAIDFTIIKQGRSTLVAADACSESNAS
ncbi:MAG: oligosaccharide repeat unit polymerase [Nitrobacter sp.]|uniref:O-antigen polymerase n=1 Tax=Nitrobacter sp. TaxID=29420 RepID=UPI00260E716A|nr:O-antigen polymerase [Nitrobacter sp.]MCV0386477.1 oligosaccharide repeat unit polymerase [Nitrobacter sp.]